MSQPIHARVSSGNSGQAAGLPLSFPKQRRVRSREDFRRVFSQGKVAADGILVVHATRANPADPPTASQRDSCKPMPTRLGLSVSKKVGHAPLRNRWKRLIREAFRQQQHALPTDLIVVVRPKKGAEPDFAEIYRSLPRLLARLDRQLAW